MLGISKLYTILSLGNEDHFHNALYDAEMLGRIYRVVYDDKCKEHLNYLEYLNSHLSTEPKNKTGKDEALMKTIASFTINHDILEKGIYISRKDGDVITYDIRMKKPNNPENDYLSPACAHTIEHLMATYMRNTEYTDSIIYVGPMGCQTGFYFLTRDDIPEETAIQLVRDSFVFIRDFEGEIPGSQRIECGQYLLHNVQEAKQTSADMLEVLKDWTPEKLTYPTE